MDLVSNSNQQKKHSVYHKIVITLLLLLIFLLLGLGALFFWKYQVFMSDQKKQSIESAIAPLSACTKIDCSINEGALLERISVLEADLKKYKEKPATPSVYKKNNKDNNKNDRKNKTLINIDNNKGPFPPNLGFCGIDEFKRFPLLADYNFVKNELKSSCSKMGRVDAFDSQDKDYFLQCDNFALGGKKVKVLFGFDAKNRLIGMRVVFVMGDESLEDVKYAKEHIYEAVYDDKKKISPNEKKLNQEVLGWLNRYLVSLYAQPYWGVDMTQINSISWYGFPPQLSVDMINKSMTTPMLQTQVDQNEAGIEYYFRKLEKDQRRKGYILSPVKKYNNMNIFAGLFLRDKKEITKSLMSQDKTSQVSYIPREKLSDSSLTYQFWLQCRKTYDNLSD